MLKHPDLNEKKKTNYVQRIKGTLSQQPAWYLIVVGAIHQNCLPQSSWQLNAYPSTENDSKNSCFPFSSHQTSGWKMGATGVSGKWRPESWHGLNPFFLAMYAQPWDLSDATPCVFADPRAHWLRLSCCSFHPTATACTSPEMNPISDRSEE